MTEESTRCCLTRFGPFSSQLSSILCGREFEQRRFVFWLAFIASGCETLCTWLHGSEIGRTLYIQGFLFDSVMAMYRYLKRKTH